LLSFLIFVCLFQIGDLPGHYHLRHDDVDELNKEHNRDKTDRLLLEKEVCYFPVWDSTNYDIEIAVYVQVIYFTLVWLDKEQRTNDVQGINWRGAWNKAPSDFWWTAKLSSQFSLCMFVNQRENLTLDQESLRAFFHASLQLPFWLKSGKRNIVEPWYNKVPRDWEIAFVITGVCHKWTVGN